MQREPRRELIWKKETAGPSENLPQSLIPSQKQVSKTSRRPKRHENRNIYESNTNEFSQSINQDLCSSENNETRDEKDSSRAEIQAAESLTFLKLLVVSNSFLSEKFMTFLQLLVALPIYRLPYFLMKRFVYFFEFTHPRKCIYLLSIWSLCLIKLLFL